ncbi:MAG: glucokinase [Pseudomonadota bacterium]|nr:glucokinase [Pseudomonadota bacterium]
MTEIVAVDIGGTHARFAIAQIADDRVVSLGEAVTLRAADHASFETAWSAFVARMGGTIPSAAGIAYAGPIAAATLRLTNSPWTIRPQALGALGVERFTLVNDFAAVAHAVAQLGDAHFRHLCGPDLPLPRAGVVSIVGPGTGLGVAQLIREAGHVHAIATEGGHIDFAPLDSIEDRILAFLRERHRRVSVERIASGTGLANIYQALAAIEGQPVQQRDDAALWAAAMTGEDSLAAAALDRFCLSLGAIAGDIALAQGASGVAIAGGVGLRLADHLPRSGFRNRFITKGRFERRMDEMPVRIVTYPEPGLFGAAAAFAAEHLASA